MMECQVRAEGQAEWRTGLWLGSGRALGGLGPMGWGAGAVGELPNKELLIRFAGGLPL